LTERLDEDENYETKRIGEINKEKTERRKQVNLDRERIKKGKKRKDSFRRLQSRKTRKK
jgi:hypothetical protein